MRRAGDVGLVRLRAAGPVSALLHVLQRPAIRILSHTVRQLDRRALLRLADVPALYLRQRAVVLVVIAMVAVRPLAVAVVLLVSRRIRARLTIVRAGLLLLLLLLRRMLLRLLAVLLLHPAVGLLSVAELRRRPLGRAALVDHTVRAVGMAAIGDLQAGRRRLGLLLAALEVRHGVDRLGLLVHQAHLGAVRRHRATLVRHRGRLRRVHVGYLTVGRHHGSRALTGRLVALRVRVGHARRIRHGRRGWLRAMRRQLLAVGRQPHLHGVIGRRAGLVGMMIHLTGRVAGTVGVHLTGATVARVVGVVRVILRTVPGQLSGVLRQVLRRMLRRRGARRGGRQRLVAQVSRSVVGARRHDLAGGRACWHVAADDLGPVTRRWTVLVGRWLSRARIRALTVRRRDGVLVAGLLRGLLRGVAVLLVRLMGLIVVARGLHLTLIVQGIRADRRLTDRQRTATVADLIPARLNL